MSATSNISKREGIDPPPVGALLISTTALINVMLNIARFLASNDETFESKQ